MVKKIVLDYTPEYDYLLLAIVSFEKDYRLIWDINQSLDFDFIRIDDFSSYNKKLGKDQFFSSFLYIDENTYLCYKLISNNSDSGSLMDELKGIDYLFMVSGEYPDNFGNSLKLRLNQVSSIQNVFMLEPSQLKARDRLIGE